MLYFYVYAMLRRTYLYIYLYGVVIFGHIFTMSLVKIWSSNYVLFSNCWAFFDIVTSINAPPPSHLFNTFLPLHHSICVYAEVFCIRCVSVCIKVLYSINFIFMSKLMLCNRTHYISKSMLMCYCSYTRPQSILCSIILTVYLSLC